GLRAHRPLGLYSKRALPLPPSARLLFVDTGNSAEDYTVTSVDTVRDFFRFLTDRRIAHLKMAAGSMTNGEETEANASVILELVHRLLNPLEVRRRSVGRFSSGPGCH